MGPECVICSMEANKTGQEIQVSILENIGGWGFTLNTMLDQLRGFSGSRINVPINSFGGNVTEGLAIYNTLRGRSEDVHTKVVGYAMSMGSVIAMAGDTVSMPENGYLMIHNPWAMTIGDVNDHQGTQKLLQMMRSDLAKIYQRKTGLDMAEIITMMDEETWMNGETALQLGFVDQVTDGADIQALFDPNELRNFQNVPVALLDPQKTTMMTVNLSEWKASLKNVLDTGRDFLAAAEEDQTEDQAGEDQAEEDQTEDHNGEDQTEDQAGEDQDVEEALNQMSQMGEQLTESVASMQKAIQARVAKLENATQASIQAAQEAFQAELDKLTERIEKSEQATAKAISGGSKRKPANSSPAEGSGSEKAFMGKIKTPGNVKK